MMGVRLKVRPDGFVTLQTGAVRVTPFPQLIVPPIQRRLGPGLVVMKIMTGQAREIPAVDMTRGFHHAAVLAPRHTDHPIRPIAVRQKTRIPSQGLLEIGLLVKVSGPNQFPILIEQLAGPKSKPVLLGLRRIGNPTDPVALTTDHRRPLRIELFWIHNGRLRRLALRSPVTIQRIPKEVDMFLRRSVAGLTGNPDLGGPRVDLLGPKVGPGLARGRVTIHAVKVP